MKFLKELIRQWKLKRLLEECKKENFCPIHGVTYLSYGRCEQCWQEEGLKRRQARSEKLTKLRDRWSELNPVKPDNYDTEPY